MGAKIDWHLVLQWWPVTIAFIVGLGFRIIAFRWIAQPLKNPLAALVLATLVGLLSFSVLLQLEDGNTRYGIYFLQCMLSIFAFSRVKSDFWRGQERSHWAVEWLGLATKGMVLLTLCGILLGILSRLARSHTGIDDVRSKMLFSLLLILFLSGILFLMNRSLRFSRIGSALLMGVLLIGFLAWITPWLNYGMGRMKLDVTVSPGEVTGRNGCVSSRRQTKSLPPTGMP